MLRVALCYVRQ